MTDRFLILAVDDNANNRFTVKELLTRLPDADVIDAVSGEEALLRTVEHDIQLILLDVQMPGIDGYETARLLQMTERTRDIPIIFLTAVFKAEEFVKRGYALGAVDYLIKPLDDNILLNRVRHYQHLHDRECRLLEAMAEMRAMQESLLQSEKLSALGSMVAGVSHELNTPLGNAKLAVSTLRDHLTDISKKYQEGTLKRNAIEEFLIEGNEIAALVNRSVDRAIDLVTTFKQVAIDQTSERRRNFNLATVIEEVIATLRLSYKNEPWMIVINVPPDIVIDSYPGPLEQIIINLVINSIRHGFDGRESGCITISGCRERESKSGIQQIAINFTDDGVGIAAHNLGRVFDPFFTTKFGQGGSGIGLNIAQRIATTLLGGSITVESEPGNGTTFTLRIPLQAPITI